MNLPELTSEQREKLSKLEAEMNAKRESDEANRERRLAASKRTGIPYDLVDVDVVKLGTLIGLIRTIEKRESSTPEEDDPDDVSVLDLFLGMGKDSAVTFDYSKIPAYFSFAPYKVREDEKVERHREYVQIKCGNYSAFLAEFLTREYEEVERAVSLSIQHLSLESFVEVVKENIEVIFDMVLESDDYDDDTLNLYTQLKVLRNSLVSVIPICEYKKLVTDQLLKLVQHKVKPAVLRQYGLSYIDAAISLFPGFSSIEPRYILAARRSLIVRAYTRDPKLLPLDMSALVKECCTPMLMFVHLFEILNCSMIGPYSNNPIGYLRSEKSYYVLKCVSGGVRMWIFDDGLRIFSGTLRKAMRAYVTKTITTVKTALAAEAKVPESHPIVVQLTNTSNALGSPDAFRKMVCSIVAAESAIIPSEADVFDHLPSKIDGKPTRTLSSDAKTR